MKHFESLQKLMIPLYTNPEKQSVDKLKKILI